MTTHTRILAAMLFFGMTAFARADNFIVGLPKDFAGSRDPLDLAVSAIFSGMKAGDTLTVLNAPENKRVTTISLPNGNASSRALRVKFFGAQLVPVGELITAATKAPAGKPASNIFFPQFLRELANTVLPGLPDKTAEVLVVGSAKYHDPREPRFSMLEGHFPSDGHLRNDDTVTPFGASNRAGSLKGVNVHFCVTDASWIDEVHRQKVQRFWSLYVEQLGGKLATFTADMQLCAQRHVSKTTDGGERYRPDPAQTKPEMIRIIRNPPRTSEAPTPAPATTIAFEQGAAFMDQGVVLATLPPETRTGKAKVGIRWDCAACDIDLYARGSAGAPFLFWKQQLTSEGRHNKDWRNSPDAEKQHEYIDFPTSIDVGNLEIYLHFYEGQAPGGARGSLRIWFEGKVYEQAFLIPAARGNQGAVTRPDQFVRGPEWLKVDARSVVGLANPGLTQ